ncbi:hypothetical protein [Ornithinimicrobium sufpigmenti]|uniref:hypothetical protein n=1 Tax=Ornithinimicrobium sufpigmenti TaxID=2508882 RepID=UPI0010364E88|nr:MULTISPECIES: hypothetical protein [unclassified Ornithinimicrobium]
MRRAGPLLTASLAVLLLAGCAGDGNGAISEEETSAQTSPHSTSLDTAQETTGPADITAGKDFGPQTIHDERGTLLKRTGQWAGLRDDEDTVTDAVFRITRIDPDLRCTAEDAAEPVNGRFIGLQVEVQTSPQLGQTGSRATFNLHPEQFTAVLPDGQTEGRLLGEGRTCLPRDEYLPDAVTAGMSVSGTLVLDAPEEAEAIVLEGLPFRSMRGWEWNLP